MADLSEPAEPLEPDCTMNGYGEGDCTFTNTTDRTASGCGHVSAWCDTADTDIQRSSTFCSGDVRPGETKDRSFNIPGFDRVTPTYGDWRDSCVFIWLPAD